MGRNNSDKYLRRKSCSLGPVVKNHCRLDCTRSKGLLRLILVTPSFVEQTFSLIYTCDGCALTIKHGFTF